MSYWSWSPDSKRYRVTAEGARALGQKPGTFVSQSKMLSFRDNYIAARKDNTNYLANQLAKGDITLNEWTLSMRQEVKDNFINQYMLAHGGRNTMTQADWGRVGQMVRGQYEYLNAFADQIASGEYSEQAIAARARMYVESSGQAFERGKIAAHGMPDLPQVPGDGRTRCLSNCKCWWEIKENDTEWRAYWRLGLAEHCLDCVENSEKWNPLVYQKSDAPTKAMLFEKLGELQDV